MGPNTAFFRRTGLQAALVLGLLGGAMAAWACDIPVWQYALNMWGQDPYRVFYVHDGGDTDSEANRLLARAAAEETANVAFEAVDVARRDEASVAGRQIADRYAGEALPTHVVVNPRGLVCQTGLLKPEGVGALLGSPARTRLCELLAAERGGVLLVLTGDSEDDNRRAAELAQAAAEQSASDQRPVWWLEVKRDDPAERLFVSQLLAVEDDLAGLTAPMVFVVFGRAHAMEPYMGRGITADAMTEMVEFLNGPCTCQIKEAGGGMDLLTDYDWQVQFGARPALTPPSEPASYVTFDTD